MSKPIILAAAAAAALAVVPAQGRQLSPSQALTRFHASAEAQKAPSSSQPETLISTITPAGQGEAALYVYSRPQGGFLVLTADDLVPALIGYSDRGDYSASTEADMPDALRWVLSGFAEQVKTARLMDANGIEVPVRSPQATPQRPAIAQKCHTSWDQDNPYNKFAPSVSGQRCPTGCVATAMAQVLKYHQHPAQAQGSIAYSYTDAYGHVQNLQADFSGTTLDWANMLNDYGYGANYNNAQANAVGTLMKVCGYGSRMMYNPQGSGTFDFEAARCLVEFLDMNPGIIVDRRRYHTATEWDNLIYAELHDNGPVLYCGADGTVSGHCFVADGFNGSNYHFNWGWSGSYDGYFSLESLVIGGWWFGYDFTWDMCALRELRPNDGTGQILPQLVLNSGSFCTDRAAYARSGEELLEVSAEPGSENTEEQNCKYFWNFTPAQLVDFRPGLRLIELADTAAQDYDPENPAPADTLYALSEPMTLDVGQRLKHYDVAASALPEGDFRADMGFQTSDGLWHEIPVELIARRELTLRVTADSVFVEGLDQNPNLNTQVTGLTVPTTFRNTNSVSVSATVKNLGAPIYTTIFPTISDGNGHSYWLEPTIAVLGTNKTVSISASGRFAHCDEFTGAEDYPEPGQYTFRLATDGGLTIGNSERTVTVTGTPTAISVVDADTEGAEVVATERFTLAGQPAAADATGLLLIRQRLADGSTRSFLQQVK